MGKITRLAGCLFIILAVHNIMTLPHVSEFWTTFWIIMDLSSMSLWTLIIVEGNKE